MTDGLSCIEFLPLAWHSGAFDEADRIRMQREAALLLAAINQMEAGHDLDGGADSRRLDRLEAKIDLTLQLLARTLEPGAPPPGRLVVLTPSGVEWEEAGPTPEGQSILLELRPSTRLPLSIRLPARCSGQWEGRVRANLEPMAEDLDEAWHQFVFRRHRQAIRARL